MYRFSSNTKHWYSFVKGSPFVRRSLPFRFTYSRYNPYALRKNVKRHLSPHKIVTITPTARPQRLVKMVSAPASRIQCTWRKPSTSNAKSNLCKVTRKTSSSQLAMKRIESKYKIVNKAPKSIRNPFKIDHRRRSKSQRRFSMRKDLGVAGKKRAYCLFFNRFGRCVRNDSCSFIHDPNKVAICTRFLRGTCEIKGCPFAHKLCADKMPICAFFVKGTCSRSECPYLHVKHSAKVPVCPLFLKGYCPKGKLCDRKHELPRKRLKITAKRRRKSVDKKYPYLSSIVKNSQTSSSPFLPDFIPLGPPTPEDKRLSDFPVPKQGLIIPSFITL